MSMKEAELIQNALQKIVVPLYPEIISVKVEDMEFSFLSIFRAIYLTSDEMDYPTKQEIAQETSSVVSMLSLKSKNPYSSDSPVIETGFITKGK